MRVVAALKRQAARQAVERAEWAEAYEDDDLVFARTGIVADLYGHPTT